MECTRPKAANDDVCAAQAVRFARPKQAHMRLETGLLLRYGFRHKHDDLLGQERAGLRLGPAPLLRAVEAPA